MASLGVEDVSVVYEELIEAGLSKDKAEEVCGVLEQLDTGYTYTDYLDMFTLIYTSLGSSLEQSYDTIQHEIKHAVEHISNYYGVDPKSEEAACLQGEIGRQLFPAMSLLLCPRKR